MKLCFIRATIFIRNLLYLKTNRFEIILNTMGKRRMEDLNTNQHGLVSGALLIVMLAFSQVVFADWQVTSPDASVPREPFFSGWHATTSSIFNCLSQ